ncbi:hypothetical protein KL942_003325 [Ogataea angusta]|uniref:Vacuolar ATPase assembly integral membrane protein VMA21 n=1 Tax=Pichia angusta TaxID=870730 RepID=A0ABQ7RW78_PICAN|nr:hypothetical protein KL942_003325 [Ogataea angusta]KAG7849347.1 hypothetical protein KL940_003029 [Ogataea angusta]
MHSRVIKKLIICTALMIIAPLLTFFVSRAVFSNSIVSGGLAALVANIVLIGYVIVAFNEDIDKDTKEKKEEEPLVFWFLAISCIVLSTFLYSNVNSGQFLTAGLGVEVLVVVSGPNPNFPDNQGWNSNVQELGLGSSESVEECVLKRTLQWRLSVRRNSVLSDVFLLWGAWNVSLPKFQRVYLPM